MPALLWEELGAALVLPPASILVGVIRPWVMVYSRDASLAGSNRLSETTIVLLALKINPRLLRVKATFENRRVTWRMSTFRNNSLRNQPFPLMAKTGQATSSPRTCTESTWMSFSGLWEMTTVLPEHPGISKTRSLGWPWGEWVLARTLSNHSPCLLSLRMCTEILKQKSF